MAKANAKRTATQQVFAAAVPAADGAQLIYASAFADAVRQINASLAQPSDLPNQLRARATELNELADLVETTLTAGEFPFKQKDADEDKADDEKKEDENKTEAKTEPAPAAVAAAAVAEPAPEPTPEPK